MKRNAISYVALVAGILILTAVPSAGQCDYESACDDVGDTISATLHCSPSVYVDIDWGPIYEPWDLIGGRGLLYEYYLYHGPCDGQLSAVGGPYTRNTSIDCDLSSPYGDTILYPGGLGSSYQAGVSIYGGNPPAYICIRRSGCYGPC
ncbi:hypothetical protein ACFLU6_10390 [Acidobacteriota bacterium]